MFAERLRAARIVLAIAVVSPARAWAQGPQTPVVQPPSPTAPQRDEQWELQLGEQRVLPTDGVRSYSEGVKGIVDVRLTKDASQFVIVALRPGATTLLLLMLDGTERHYQITVVDQNAPKRDKQQSETVEARDNIRLDFYFVQVSRNNAYQIGIGWPGSVAPTFNAAYDVKAGVLDSATAIISNQALPRLDMAQTAGWAKVMRQAAVVTANGDKASFAGGGEVNIAIQSALQSGIQKIPFGSQIDVEPHYDSSTGRIELKLHADVSELDSDRGTGVPGRITATLDTVVNLELGQSLILAGLTARSEHSSKAGLPGLSQIPILGVLFGSHSHSEEESENVTIIVPSVVDAVSMEDRKRLDDALRQYDGFSGDLDDVDFVPAAKLGHPRSAPAARSR